MTNAKQPSKMVYFFFFFSGATALVYEIIWTRMLTLTFGHTVFSVSIVLAAFMAGLGFGSYLWGYLIDSIASGSSEKDFSGKSSPILIYAVLEILIFITCALLSLGFSQFDLFYAWFHQWIPESPILLNGIKAGLAFGLIFIPASLMGATFPVISKYYVTDEIKLTSQVGILYGLNTLGAAFGCIFTGFIFISVFGVLETALIASFFNLVIGIGAFRIFQEDEGGTFRDIKLPKISFPPLSWSRGQSLWVVISFVSGFTALAYQIIWTRLLVFSIASTVYSFSLMLAVFLLGIVIGSFLVIPLIKKLNNQVSVLICLQAGTGLYVLFSVFGMDILLSPPWNGYNLQNPMKVFARYFSDSAALMLVPTILLGMNFPLLIRMVSGGFRDIGKGTGQVYAFNTLGAIIGSLLAGFIFLPFLKTANSLVFISSLNLFTALVLFYSGDYLTSVARKGLTAVFAGVIIFLNFSIPQDILKPFFLRDGVAQRDDKKLLFFNEGLTSTVSVFEDNYGILDPAAKRLVTNGISMSASNYIASRYMKLLAHIPILLSDDPKDVLVICYGTGQTTGIAGIHPKVNSVDSVELSTSVVKASFVFKEENHDAVNNKPKVNIIFQDGRNHLLTTKKLYDVVTGEPPPPRTAFTVNLYTKDYYELIKKRLKKGGIVAQWVPLHSQSGKEIDMHLQTFLEVFPNSMAWLPVANELLLIGSDQPINIDYERLKSRMSDPVIKKALSDIAIDSPASLLGNIWFLENQMQKISERQPLITDNHPLIEFYLNYPDVIKTYGLERLVFNRAPVGEIEKLITKITPEEIADLRRYYKVLDLYQRGVMYGNRAQLMEAMELSDNDGLFRYHLQAGEDMIARLQAMLTQDPGDLNALLNLGHSFYKIGKYEESSFYLEKVLAEEPGTPFANLYMGFNMLELEEYDEAEKYFKAAAKSNPAQMRTVMKELALVELLRKFQGNAESKDLMLAVAQFFNVKNEFRKSLKYSLQVLQDDATNKNALKSIVFSYLGLGEPEEALIYGAQYENVDSDNIDLQYIMGDLYIKTLRCNQAIPYLEKVLKKDDTFRNAQRLLDKCKNDIGKVIKKS
jgi:predicted membrane-bound spermidine synthase/tetratricopeptide (TPR) repeat protein